MRPVPSEVMALKRLMRPARKSPLPGKNRPTGRPGFARHVPDDDLLTVGRGQHILFGLRQTGRGRRRTPDRRDRKQHFALLEVEHGDADEIDGGKNNDDPFQNSHWSERPTLSLARFKQLPGVRPDAFRDLAAAADARVRGMPFDALLARCPLGHAMGPVPFLVQGHGLLAAFTSPSQRSRSPSSRRRAASWCCRDRTGDCRCRHSPRRASA